MLNDAVPLTRSFSLVPESEVDADKEERHSLWLGRKLTFWQDLEKEFRCVILAEAGAGKSFEMEARARHVAASGRPAFFIRIEDIADGFETAFEVGDVRAFESWLDSQEEAWFFLDSVDEARLEDPRAFEKAIRRFAARVAPAGLRAHVFISSRPYAWRPRLDQELLEKSLPFRKVVSEEEGDGKHPLPERRTGGSKRYESALSVYVLRPLDEQGIRFFAEHRGAPQIDRLIADLQRSNLMSMAARPFDLEGILVKWKADRVLGGRLELLQHNIDASLTEIHPDRSSLRPLSREQARRGARVLAAAVILTGEPGIRVPDSARDGAGIDAEAVLADWDPSDVQALLERGIFNDVLYGVVRFRHREVRELLAAEWFDHHLKNGPSRRAIEALFIREQYGRMIITPRLRPILPWLILFDGEMRHKVLAIAPEISVEGGDAAQLPLSERKLLLADIVQRIVADKGDSARDNSAIARIAQADLASDVLRLAADYRDNDDALFFLGRLVWQGEMAACVPAFLMIAADAGRGIYARIAAARAVMTCGDRQQRDSLWVNLLESPGLLPRKLLAEMLGNADPDLVSVEFLLRAVGKLGAYQRYESTGFDQALHGFIDHLQPDGTVAARDTLTVMMDGLNGYLAREPHVDWKECHVSREFLWLLGPAAHIVERLVLDQSAAALSPGVLSIMLRLPAAHFWQSDDFKAYKTCLHEIVPKWTVLNDALFWHGVREERTRLDEDGSGRVIDVWRVGRLGHYWGFDAERFDDVLNFIGKCEVPDDKLLVLSLAHRLFVLAGQPDDLLDRLKRSVEADAELKQRLAVFLNVEKSQADLEYERKIELRENRLRSRNALRDRRYAGWVRRLKAAPDIIRHPPGVSAGEVSHDQCRLMEECGGAGSGVRGRDGSSWKALIPGFGMDVAKSYRDAAVAHWRHFTPAFGSEGADTSTISYALIFGLEGISMEAGDADGFYKNLTEQEIRHVLRYFVWGWDGLPLWLEPLHQAHPALVLEAMSRELFWDLSHVTADQVASYVLNDVAHCASWSHKHLAPDVAAWLENNEVQNSDALRSCLYILLNGGLEGAVLSKLSESKILTAKADDRRSIWYALWIYVDAGQGIPAVREWLSGLENEEASRLAQLLITNLMGARGKFRIWPERGDFYNVNDLQALYMLMHQYIKVEDDIDRSNTGVYSPGLRDYAQDGRDALFNWLSEIPGKETYIALSQIARNHPATKFRPWIEHLAYERAEKDGDLDFWSARQVREYDRDSRLTPATHRQLFELATDRLFDLKAWLECGNESPYKTWQRAESETEMRNLITGWLRGRSSGHYVCAQENEFPNGQRPDILIQSGQVPSPIPIELKLLDKGWSGPLLCERLRNQLAGDYMRENAASCGIMLLVWQGCAGQTHWMIEDRAVARQDLPEALNCYWDGISGDFPGIVEIKVILIDLTAREGKSDN